MSKNRDIASFLSGTARTNSIDSAGITGIGGGGTSGTFTLFDTLDSLPMSGLKEGEEALVQENKRLYISNGSGWYNTSVFSLAPSWDVEPSGAYSVADSVTPLVVIAKAQDSDTATLLDQSFASDSAQYMVDITVDSSVWTFTPKSADSIGIEVAAGNLNDSNGDFIYTFKWSDGIDFVAKEVTISYSTTIPPSNATSTGFFTRSQTPTGYSGITSNNLGQTGSFPWLYCNSVASAPDGSYYKMGREANYGEGSFLIKVNGTGTKQWARKFGVGRRTSTGAPNYATATTGNYYTRCFDVEVDANNNPIIAGYDAGYAMNHKDVAGANVQGNWGHVAKFNSGGGRTWSKIIKWKTIPNPSYYKEQEYVHMALDSYGNIWSIWRIRQSAYDDTPVQYNSEQLGITKINSDGSLGFCGFAPPANTSAAHYPRNITIDSNDKMHIITSAGGSSGSGSHTLVQRFSIPQTGAPTYDYTFLYGQFESSSHTDVAYNISMCGNYSSDFVTAGFCRQTDVNTDDHGYIVKHAGSDGSIIWGKRLDRTYGQHIWGMAVNDVGTEITTVQTVDNQGYRDEVYIRRFSAEDGSQIGTWKAQFSGSNPNPNMQVNRNNPNPYGYPVTTYWYNWTQTGNCLKSDVNGNIIMAWGMSGGSGGYDHRPTIVKFPKNITAGTYGDLVLTSISSPTDYTYGGTEQTYNTYGTITDKTSDFESVNYNSGTFGATLGVGSQSITSSDVQTIT